MVLYSNTDDCLSRDAKFPLLPYNNEYNRILLGQPKDGSDRKRSGI